MVANITAVLLDSASRNPEGFKGVSAKTQNKQKQSENTNCHSHRNVTHEVQVHSGNFAKATDPCCVFVGGPFSPTRLDCSLLHIHAGSLI